LKPIQSVVIALLLSVCFFNTYSQGTSNKGTEFWTTYMNHINGAGVNNGSNMILYITSDISTTGNVDVVDGSFSQSFNVTANQVTFVTIPASAFLGNTNGTSKKGIHITSLSPIAVYAHIYANSVSGATLLFPVSAMGKTYVSLNYTQLSNANPSYSIFNIIATEDATTISITPSAPLIDGSPAGKAFNIVLNKGEVYQGLADKADLTGTKIQSISTSTGICKKIAVFSGSNKIGIGCGGGGTSDNLFQQVYPTSAWGKNYITAPLASRPYDVYRVVLSDANTNVTINGAVITAAQFTSGYYEFPSTTTNVISADKPIQVVQYSASQGCPINSTGRGDPEMIYLSPIEQGLDHVTLYSTGYYLILNSYINVVIPTSAVSSFTLDGSPYTAFTPVPNSNGYSYAQIPVSSGPQSTNGSGSVTSGTHTIKASEPFNAIAYGFGAQESYGYAAGTNLQDLTEYVQFQNPQNNNVQTSGCVGVDYKLQVTMPYQTTKITWQVDGVIKQVDANPQYVSSKTVGTQTLYTYEYTGLMNFAVGNHIIIAKVFNPVADECGSDVDISYNFEITGLLTVDFAVPANTCLGDVTAFKDNSVSPAATTVKSWLWDFGDGQTSALQNPTHTYLATGDYTVALTITDANGCTTISTPKTIHIAKLPVAGFNVSTPNCEGQNMTFTDNSSSIDGTIVKWAWDYGDGKTDNFTNGVPVINHIYTTAGTYNVVLTVTTDKGCSHTITTAIVVNPLPVVDFTLPEICLADAFAQFTDKTTIASGSITNYLWDFGDAVNSTALNPNTSTSKNPRHKYINTGVYTATLTVTSSSGCVSVKSQQFTVNSSMPKAAFSYPSTICSSDDVVFKDESFIDVGNIIKVVWYFDYDNNPIVFKTFTTADMPANKMYYHQYPLSNSTKHYKVRMEVYSGQTCSSVVEHDITVNANPIVTLTPASGLTLCQSDAPVQIIENRNGFIGTPLFTGTGISPTGLFDPKLSGTGTFTIDYLFTTSNTGCTYATTLQITVNPTPEITLASNLQFLEGGQLKIEPTVKISSGPLTYKWSPSTGLDHDDILNPIANPTDDITYTLTVTSDKLCSAVAKVAVTVLKAPIVNNTFTPNGDGVNDTWTIKYLESYPKATVTIFNRLGEQLFYSVGYPIAWDGRYRGTDLPTGVYYYIINPNTAGRKTYSGYVSIIK
jgi:gliding motility-associated-like protein